MTSAWKAYLEIKLLTFHVLSSCFSWNLQFLERESVRYPEQSQMFFLYVRVLFMGCLSVIFEVLISRENVQSGPLIAALFHAFDTTPGAQNSHYLMKAIMRCFNIIDVSASVVSLEYLLHFVLQSFLKPLIDINTALPECGQYSWSLIFLPYRRLFICRTFAAAMSLCAEQIMAHVFRLLSWMLKWGKINLVRFGANKKKGLS